MTSIISWDDESRERGLGSHENGIRYDGKEIEQKTEKRKKT